MNHITNTILQTLLHTAHESSRKILEAFLNINQRTQLYSMHWLLLKSCLYLKSMWSPRYSFVVSSRLLQKWILAGKWSVLIEGVWWLAGTPQNSVLRVRALDLAACVCSYYQHLNRKKTWCHSINFLVNVWKKIQVLFFFEDGEEEISRSGVPSNFHELFVSALTVFLRKFTFLMLVMDMLNC